MSINFDKPVQTHDGRRVTILTVEARDKDYPILGYVGEDTDLACWSTEGNRSWGPDRFSLINVPEKRCAYLNVYSDRSVSFPTRMEADIWAIDNRTGCMKIEIVEGQFDE